MRGATKLVPSAAKQDVWLGVHENLKDIILQVIVINTPMFLETPSLSIILSVSWIDMPFGWWRDSVHRIQMRFSTREAFV